MPAMVVSDFVNPLVVKEVRQGLRTEVFWFCFALLVLACLGAAMAAFAQHRAGDVVDLGPRYFFLFFVALSAVKLFVVPFGAFRSLSREREDDTWTLLVLTGLSARRILRGKVTSALLQGGVYASAVAPFMLFSYFLNGIDLPTLLTVLGLSAVLAFSLCCMAVAAATVGTRGPTRALAHFAWRAVPALLGAASRDEATRVWLQLSSSFTGLFNFLMAVRSSTSYAHRSQDELLLALGVAAALTALAAECVLAWRDRR